MREEHDLVSDLSNSYMLRRKIDLVLGELLAAANRLTNHPQIRELYPEYLYSLHTMIRASVPLMEAALKRAQHEASSDPVCVGLAAYLSQHIREEMHHDEWLLDDMETLGLKRSQILERIPSPSAAALVGSQYYWIFHHHPIALLGYIAVMEGYPPTEEYIERLRQKTGYPAEAFRTLAKHGHLDPYHRDGLDHALDALALQPTHTALIGVSAMESVHMAARVFSEIVERHSESSDIRRGKQAALNG